MFDTLIDNIEHNEIVDEIIAGWKNNLQRPQVVELTNAVKFILNQNSFNADALPCQVFAGRTLLSLTSRHSDFCMGQYFDSLEDCKASFIEAHNQSKYCKVDETCLAHEYCWYRACPKNSLDAHGEFGHVEELECALNQVSYYSGLYLIQQIQEQEINSFYKDLYIRGCINQCGG